jgi:CubicO group peptidase (beta-lactamase class C family)
MTRTVFKTSLLAFLLLSAGFAQSDVAARIGRVEKGLLPPVLIKGAPTFAIEEQLRRYKIPGVSVAVINDYKIEWAKAYGVTDVETKEPVTTETLFQAGSISKPVAAMAALKKVQEGKISLEEDINNKLVTWKLPENQLTAKKKVTLANLLSHTGGLTVHGFPGYAVGEPIPTLPQVLDGAPPANTPPVRVDLEPGAQYRYSGGGVTIAQLAIMDIEKKPYPQIARENVLAPLGMTHSTYEQPLPADWRKKAATGHREGGFPVEGKIHVYPEMAAAGLWTTPTDLAKFAIEVQLSLAGKSNKVLSKEMVEKMVTPYANDSAGLGFFLEKHAGALYFGHNGADEGFRAQLLVSRTKGYGVAVMVNSDNSQVINEITRAVAREYNWDDFLPPTRETVAVAPETLKEYLGRFKVNPDRVLKVTQQNGKLYGEPTEAPKFEFFPISDVAFLRNDQDVRYTFVKGTSGKADSVKILVNGREITAPRIADETLIPYEALAAGKISEAVEGYRKIKKDTPQHAVVGEERLNLLGYSLLQQKKLPEAIALFKLNAEFYPNSFNVYDSLGEAYMASGDKALAVANYKKSVELNPRNENGAQMLKKLEGGSVK